VTGAPATWRFLVRLVAVIAVLLGSLQIGLPPVGATSSSKAPTTTAAPSLDCTYDRAPEVAQKLVEPMGFPNAGEWTAADGYLGNLPAPAIRQASVIAAEGAGIPAGSTIDAATSGGRITSSVRGRYFQDGAEPPVCSYCQQNPAEHLDHVIPRSQGGDLTSENLTPACSWCNLSKGARVAPVNPPSGYVGEWPPSFWPSRMSSWWTSTYGGP